MHSSQRGQLRAQVWQRQGSRLRNGRQDIPQQMFPPSGVLRVSFPIGDCQRSNEGREGFSWLGLLLSILYRLLW